MTADLKARCRELVSQINDCKDTACEDCERCRGLVESFARSLIEGQWRTMESAPRDGTTIIYLADCLNGGGEFVGEMVWRRPEVLRAHWWDDSATMEVDLPKGWMPRPVFVPPPPTPDAGEK